jgi:hypothetical protein
MKYLKFERRNPVPLRLIIWALENRKIRCKMLKNIKNPTQQVISVVPLLKRDVRTTNSNKISVF